mmetsp:Transcript_10677/g.23532  ORF Transcript_10677/g.23532 Transcript_10677/m.23532 type:complete len:92 (-) Transcript_10677:186-461(-)
MATKSQRKICWEHRDAYFGCLDDPARGDHGKCLQEYKSFEDQCPASWVMHFVSQRNAGTTNAGAPIANAQPPKKPMSLAEQLKAREHQKQH